MRISKKQFGDNSKKRTVLMAISLVMVQVIFLGFFYERESSPDPRVLSPSSLLRVAESHKKNRNALHAVLNGDLFNIQNLNAEKTWDELVREGSKIGGAVAVEVGMHTAKWCIQAAKAGLSAHCVEPSPVSFERVEKKVKEEHQDIQSRIHLYNAAAGDSVGYVTFTGSGGTGDHVGEFDVWNMKAGKSSNAELAKKQGKTVQVPSIRLDDVIDDSIQSDVFVMKVDTQGFEPAVLSGLTNSLNAHKIQFLLMEYWPAGIDMMSGKPSGTCAAADLLKMLVSYGYTIYALPPTSHPAAPEAAKLELRNFRDILPLSDIDANCKWFYQHAEKHRSDTYKMGYWSDVLAVAPGTVLDSPVTELGKVFMRKQ